MMKLKITCFIVLFLMVSVNLVNTDTLSFTAPLEDEETSREVIVPLSSANIPGSQEGSIYTNTTLSSGSSSNCAILDDGTVSCWGFNTYGQLGDGTNSDQSTPVQPWNAGVGRTAVAISFGNSHICALLDDGSVSCLGFNLYGQFGDGANSNQNTPTQTSSFGSGRSAVEISAGAHHTCAILDDGSVSCWGYNWYGQLGDGNNGNSANRNTPTQTSSLGTGRTAIAISSGNAHTCAVLDDGSVSCWGSNGNGQLGDGTNTVRYTPTPTSSFGTGRTAVAISSGDSHTCALLDDASVSCWGSNGDGRLGDGTNSSSRNTPTQTSSLGTGRTAVAISSGGTHTCAVLDDASVSCWGYNYKGALGDGTSIDRNTPTQTSSLGTGRTAIAISSGTAHTCAVLDDASVSCWGDGSHGEIGDGTNTDRNTPTQTSSLGTGRTVAVSERDWDNDGILNIFDNTPNGGTSNESENNNNNSTNNTEPTNSTNGTEPTNSTNVIEYVDYECTEQDFDCDGSPNNGDNDDDADGIMDLADPDELSTEVKWLHKFTIVKTSDGFEIQIEYRVPNHNAYGSHVSWVMSVDENGNERDMPLMWDIAMDGSSFKMGVSSTHMDELKQNLCQNPHGSPLYSDFDMYEWLNNSVIIEGVHVVPTEIGCSWKNQPKEVDLNKLTADMQSEDFLFRMHKEYEVLKYTIKYDVSEDSQNLTILPIWAVNDTIGTSSSSKAFYVDDQVNGTTSVWFWWSQSYSSAFDLENAEVGAMNSSISGLMSNIGFVVAALLGILIIRRRRRKKKLKRAIKKIAKEQIMDEKAAKKQAKLEKKKIKAESKAIATDLTDTNSANIEYDLDENTKPIIALPPQEIQESEPEKPFKPPENTSQLSPVGPINFDTDGYEWSTDRFERPIYRVAGSSEHWSLWES